jgi:hypothetical protein
LKRRLEEWGWEKGLAYLQGWLFTLVFHDLRARYGGTLPNLDRGYKSLVLLKGGKYVAIMKVDENPIEG